MSECGGGLSVQCLVDLGVKEDGCRVYSLHLLYVNLGWCCDTSGCKAGAVMDVTLPLLSFLLSLVHSFSPSHAVMTWQFPGKTLHIFRFLLQTNFSSNKPVFDWYERASVFRNLFWEPETTNVGLKISSVRTISTALWDKILSWDVLSCSHKGEIHNSQLL